VLVDGRWWWTGGGGGREVVVDGRWWWTGGGGGEVARSAIDRSELAGLEPPGRPYPMNRTMRRCSICLLSDGERPQGDCRGALYDADMAHPLIGGARTLIDTRLDVAADWGLRGASPSQALDASTSNGDCNGQLRINTALMASPKPQRQLGHSTAIEAHRGASRTR
jgi:hypothetical protein